MHHIQTVVNKMRMRILWILLLLLVTTMVHANGSHQLATGGGTAFEGSAGGGLVPWAVLAGYATD